MINGPMTAVFHLAMLIPVANNRGALMAMLVGTGK